METPSVTIEPLTKMSSQLSKLTASFEKIKNDFQNQKNTLDDTMRDLKLFEKTMNSFVKKQTSVPLIEKKPRKKSGFALPSLISDDLCEFMGLEKGSKCARTDVTKSLNVYIANNNLQNQDNKQYIDPDDKLWKILGDEARGQDVTYFTIQKYINKHFIKEPVV
jgi:chromatin remodeling complex protein RSC6